MKPHLRRVSFTCRRCYRAASLQIIDSDGHVLDGTYYCEEHAEGALLDYLNVLGWDPADVRAGDATGSVGWRGRVVFSPPRLKL
jgi:hypothetical protein